MTHIRRMYGQMADRFQAPFEQYGHALALDRLRDDVPNHFGKGGDEATRDIVDILEFGISRV